MNIHDNRRRFQNSQIGLARSAMTATRSATDFEIMQQEHIEQMRAEIERLRARNAILDNAIAEVTEEQAALCAEDQSITELVAAKDKRIEQMRKVLRGVCEKCPCDTSARCKDCDVGAALSAAERGE